jgi:hypothetical protein
VAGRTTDGPLKVAYGRNAYKILWSATGEGPYNVDHDHHGAQGHRSHLQGSRLSERTIQMPRPSAPPDVNDYRLTVTAANRVKQLAERCVAR